MMQYDEQFFNKLYTDSFVLLKKYVFSKIDSNEAEDILQETYYQAYRNVNILKEHPNPTGWLMLTCKNILNKHIAKNKKELDKTYIGATEDLINNLPAVDDYDWIYM